MWIREIHFGPTRGSHVAPHLSEMGLFFSLPLANPSPPFSHSLLSLCPTFPLPLSSSFSFFQLSHESFFLHDFRHHHVAGGEHMLDVGEEQSLTIKHLEFRPKTTSDGAQVGSRSYASPPQFLLYSSAIWPHISGETSCFGTSILPSTSL